MKRHWSDCAVHSEPAYPAGECDCGGCEVYYCVICGELQVVDGVVVHKEIPHDIGMTFDEENKPQ